MPHVSKAAVSSCSAAAQDIMALLLDFHQHGTTVLVATHDQQLMQGLMARHMARRLTLQHGRLLPSSDRSRA
jgi:ABC-type ATPase involved in cell division